MKIQAPTGIAAVALLATLPALAQTSSSAPSPGTSTLTAAVPQTPTWRERLSVSYWGVYEGTSILSPLDQFQPSSTERRSDTPIDLVNLLPITYKLSPTVSIQPTAIWTVAGRPEGGLSASLNDPFIALNVRKWVATPYLNSGMQVRYSVPVSESSQAAQSLGAVRATHFLTLQHPDSRFSLGLNHWVQGSLVEASAPGFNSMSVYAGPNLFYQVSPNVALNVLYEARAAWRAGTGGFVSTGTDLEPGVSWDITPTITFNPYLDLKTSTGIKMETTSINAFVAFKLL